VHGAGDLSDQEGHEDGRVRRSLNEREYFVISQCTAPISAESVVKKLRHL
jgi:hypothetical protein